MIHVPKFEYRLASAQAKDERLDWVISQLKKNKRFDLKKLSEFERLEVEEFIQEHCRALRLSRITRARVYKPNIIRYWAGTIISQKT